MTEDYTEIWLEPDCCADHAGVGRTWCQDDVYECEHGVEPTHYIREDIMDDKLTEIARIRLDLESELNKARDEIRQLQDALAFYGDPETYHACSFAFDRPTGGFDEDFSDDHGHPDYDRPMPGKLARETLNAAPASDKRTGFERNCTECGKEYGGIGTPLCPDCFQKSADVDSQLPGTITYTARCSYWPMRLRGWTDYPYDEHWRDCDICQKIDPDQSNRTILEPIVRQMNPVATSQERDS